MRITDDNLSKLKDYIYKNKIEVRDDILEAMWQYALEHAQVEYNGAITTRFTVHEKQEFFNHLNARVHTEYAKVDFEGLKQFAEEAREKYRHQIKEKPVRSKIHMLYLDLLHKLRRFCSSQIVLLDYPYVREKSKTKSKLFLLNSRQRRIRGMQKKGQEVFHQKLLANNVDTR